MAFNTTWPELTWAAREIFAPVVADHFFKSRPVIRMLRKNVDLRPGGRQYVLGGLYDAIPATFLNDKNDPIVYTYKEEYGAAQSFPKILERTVVLNLLDAVMDGPGKTQTYDLLKLRSISAANAMADTADRALFALNYNLVGAAAGQGVFNSLDHAVNDQTGTGDETGFSATYLGVTRAATGDTAGWRATVDDTTATLSPETLTLNELKASEGTEKTNLYVTNNKGYSLMYNRLTAIQREGAENLTGMAGFKALLVNGNPFVVDSNCPSANRSVPITDGNGVVWGTAPSTEYVYGFNMDHIRMWAFSDYFFSFMDVAAPHDRLIVLGRYLTIGNVFCDAPRFQFKMSAITG